MAELKVLNLKEVTAKVSLGKTTIYALIKTRAFPKGVSLCGNGHAVRWLESDVDQWLTEKFRLFAKKG